MTDRGHIGLLSLSSPIPEDTSTVPWRIDNKYYTVAAHFLLTPISSGDVIQASEVPVVIYLFAGSVRSRVFGHRHGRS